MSYVYVIREQEFPYSDEYYISNEAVVGSISDSYESNEEAEQICRQMVVQAWRNGDMGNYDVFCGCGDDEISEKIDAFLSQIGQDRQDSGTTDDLVAQLTDEQVFELAQISQILHYVVLEVSQSADYYALWIPAKKAYFRQGYTEATLLELSIEALQDKMRDYWSSYWLINILDRYYQNLKFDELSDQPDLLRQVLAQSHCIRYHESGGRFSVSDDGFELSEVLAVSELLKQPILELKKLDLEQAQKV